MILSILLPDGLRTIAGTERIADVELGTVSKQIQDRIDEIGTARLSSVVIRSKSQHRLFYPTEAQAQASARGLIGVIKAGIEGGIGWEYAGHQRYKSSVLRIRFYQR